MKGWLAGAFFLMTSTVGAGEPYVYKSTVNDLFVVGRNFPDESRELSDPKYTVPLFSAQDGSFLGTGTHIIHPRPEFNLLDKYIITAHHVYALAGGGLQTTNSFGQKKNLRLLFADPGLDFAILKISHFNTEEISGLSHGGLTLPQFVQAPWVAYPEASFTLPKQRYSAEGYFCRQRTPEQTEDDGCGSAESLFGQRLDNFDTMVAQNESQGYSGRPAIFYLLTAVLPSHPGQSGGAFYRKRSTGDELVGMHIANAVDLYTYHMVPAPIIYWRIMQEPLRPCQSLIETRDGESRYRLSSFPGIEIIEHHNSCALLRPTNYGTGSGGGGGTGSGGGGGTGSGGGGGTGSGGGASADHRLCSDSQALPSGMEFRVRRPRHASTRSARIYYELYGNSEVYTEYEPPSGLTFDTLADNGRYPSLETRRPRGIYEEGGQLYTNWPEYVLSDNNVFTWYNLEDPVNSFRYTMSHEWDERCSALSVSARAHDSHIANGAILFVCEKSIANARVLTLGFVPQDTDAGVNVPQPFMVRLKLQKPADEVRAASGPVPLNFSVAEKQGFDLTFHDHTGSGRERSIDLQTVHGNFAQELIQNFTPVSVRSRHGLRYLNFLLGDRNLSMLIERNGGFHITVRENSKVYFIVGPGLINTNDSTGDLDSNWSLNRLPTLRQRLCEPGG